MIFSSLLLSSALLAQTQRPAETRAAENVDRPTNSMAEHIEIFRKILGRKLHPARSAYGYRGGQNLDAASTYYSPINGTLWSQDGVSDLRGWSADGGDASVEGVYLNGFGVVFTTTLPSWTRGGKPSDDKPVAKPLSDWERAQIEFRGEKQSVAAAPPAAQRAPSARDIILRVLADNGAHLSRLRDDEHVSVVVTFRDYGSPFMSNALPTAISSTLGLTTTQPAMTGQNPYAPKVVPSQTAAPAGAQNRAPSSARDYELLADLHLKQQEYQTAIEAYAKAIAGYQEEAKSGQSADTDVNRNLRPLLLRQAQAQLGLGHEDRAMELLQKARSAGGGNLTATTARESTKDSAKPRVPSKLIISATKRQLDQIEQGKMTPEEFRKAVSIEEE
jgi:tetratricopeptide (TPR) repeat protein